MDRPCWRRWPGSCSCCRISPHWTSGFVEILETWKTIIFFTICVLATKQHLSILYRKIKNEYLLWYRLTIEQITKFIKMLYKLSEKFISIGESKKLCRNKTQVELGGGYMTEKLSFNTYLVWFYISNTIDAICSTKSF